MSNIWDALTGRRSSSQHSSSSSQPTAGAPSGPTLSLQTPAATEPSSTFDSYSPSSSATDQGGVASFLSPSAFADPSQLHPLAGLDAAALEYITLEESALSDLPGSQSVLPSRGWTDDLCYGTGVTYLAALATGGAWGLQEGLRRSAGQPPKLRLNSVLNAVTRRGPFLGNSAGVIAICYNGVNSYVGYLRGRHDSANSVLAGGISGMLFKSTRGLKPMLISGGIVATAAGAWAVARRTFSNSQSRLHL